MVTIHRSKFGGIRHLPFGVDIQNARIENKPPVLYRWKLTFNLATIDRPPGKPPMIFPAANEHDPKPLQDTMQSTISFDKRTANTKAKRSTHLHAIVLTCGVAGAVLLNVVLPAD